jgi:diguanylate cyclase (GGDEF)-like protein
MNGLIIIKTFIFRLMNIKKRTSQTPFHPNIWGMLPFLLFLLIIAVLWYLERNFPKQLLSFQETYLVGIGPLFIYLFGLVVMLSITMVAFPHVPNLKVSLLGYLFLIIGMLYAFRLADSPYFKHWDHLTPLYFLGEINLLLISIAPGFIRRETNRIVCGVTISAELGVILHLLGKGPVVFYFTKSHEAWILYLCGATIITSWFFTKNSYGLGGGLSGLACYYAFGNKFSNSPIEDIVWLSIPSLSSFIILYNWLIRLSHRVSYDPVMNVYTRGFCNNIIHGHANVRLGNIFSIAMIDIDHFKRINDTYGHDAGDRVLHTIAQLVRSYALPRGITCRYGGEELAVFFPRTDMDRTVAIAKRIHKAVGGTTINVTKDKKEKLTVSIGIATNSEGESTLHTLKRADSALYRAKHEGRNRIRKAKDLE